MVFWDKEKRTDIRVYKVLAESTEKKIKTLMETALKQVIDKQKSIDFQTARDQRDSKLQEKIKNLIHKPKKEKPKEKLAKTTKKTIKKIKK